MSPIVLLVEKSIPLPEQDDFAVMSSSSSVQQTTQSHSVLHFPFVVTRTTYRLVVASYRSASYSIGVFLDTVHLFFRPLNLEQVSVRLRGLRPVVRLLESFIRIPFVVKRFGLLTLLGLVPFAAPVASCVVSSYPLILASQIPELPKYALWRMFGNLGIAIVLGCVPYIGGAAVNVYKPNTKNVRILEGQVDRLVRKQGSRAKLR